MVAYETNGGPRNGHPAEKLFDGRADRLDAGPLHIVAINGAPGEVGEVEKSPRRER
jgi:hypothetical protein